MTTGEPNLKFVRSTNCKFPVTRLFNIRACRHLHLPEIFMQTNMWSNRLLPFGKSICEGDRFCFRPGPMRDGWTSHKTTQRSVSRHPSPTAGKQLPTDISSFPRKKREGVRYRKLWGKCRWRNGFSSTLFPFSTFIVRAKWQQSGVQFEKKRRKNSVKSKSACVDGHSNRHAKVHLFLTVFKKRTFSSF